MHHVAALILNLTTTGSEWWTSRTGHFTRENNSGVHWMGRWEGGRIPTVVVTLWRKEKALVLTGYRTPDRPARSAVAIPTALPRLPFKCCARVYYVVCVCVCVCESERETTEQPFWEADNHSEGQGITWLLGNPYIHCGVYNSPLLLSTLRQMHIVHILANPSRICDIYFNTILGLQVSIFQDLLPPPFSNPLIIRPLPFSSFFI